MLFPIASAIVSQVFNNRFTIVPNILLCYTITLLINGLSRAYFRTEKENYDVGCDKAVNFL